MSAPEIQPADRTLGNEPADLPPTQGECLDEDFYSSECIKEFCSNGDVLYCYSSADTLLGADIAGDSLFPSDSCDDKNERGHKRAADVNDPRGNAALRGSFQ